MTNEGKDMKEVRPRDSSLFEVPQVRSKSRPVGKDESRQIRRLRTVLARRSTVRPAEAAFNAESAVQDSTAKSKDEGRQIPGVDPESLGAMRGIFCGDEVYE